MTQSNEEMPDQIQSKNELSSFEKILLKPDETLANTSIEEVKPKSSKPNPKSVENGNSGIEKPIKLSQDEITKESEAYKLRYNETKNSYLKSQREYAQFRNESSKLFKEALTNPDNEFKTNEEIWTEVEKKLSSFKPMEVEMQEQSLAPVNEKKNQFMQSFASDISAYNRFHPNKNILKGAENTFEFLYNTCTQAEIDEIEQDLELLHKQDPSKAIEHMEDLIQKLTPIMNVGGFMPFLGTIEKENESLRKQLEEKETLLQQKKEKIKKLTYEVDETHKKVNNLEYDPTISSSYRNDRNKPKSKLLDIISGQD